MRPILFELAGIPFASWYVFFGLGGLAAFALAFALLRQADQGGSVPGAEVAFDAFPSLFAICYVAGWFGARLFSLLREQIDVNTPADFLRELVSIGPMTFYGGAIAAFFAGLFFSLVRKLPVGLLGDALFPAASLGLALGRVGCHLNGDDFGLVLANQAEPPWWSVTYPSLGDGLARFPVQLEEAAFSFLVAAVAAGVFVRRAEVLRPGALAACVAMVSAAHRFLNEYFRGDPRGHFWGTSLSTSQGLALLVFFGAGFALFALFAFDSRNRQPRPALRFLSGRKEPPP